MHCDQSTEDITYNVLGTDEEGNQVDKSDLPYEVIGEGEVSFIKDSTKDSVTITNTIQVTIRRWAYGWQLWRE